MGRGFQLIVLPVRAATQLDHASPVLVLQRIGMATSQDVRREAYGAKLTGRSGSASPAASRRRRFYVGMGIVAILVVLIGFSDSITGGVTGRRSLTPLVHIHAAIFLSWLILFVVQSSLVSAGRTALHRRLGTASVVLGVAMLWVGFETAVAGARRGYPGNGDPLGFMIHPLGDLLSFAILFGAGFWYRRRPEVHKRLMLLATVGAMMNAPLSHVHGRLPEAMKANPLSFLLPMVLLLGASAVYDRLSRGRIHPVSLWGAILLFAWGNVREMVIGPSRAWHQVADLIVR
jgi:hypothetical protein